MRLSRNPDGFLTVGGADLLQYGENDPEALKRAKPEAFQFCPNQPNHWKEIFMHEGEHLLLNGEQPPFADLIGFRTVSASRDEVVAELLATEALTNRNGVLHGGAIMAFADHLGGLGAIANLHTGQATTTIESKTNFLRPVSVGDVLRGVCVPLHKGRTTQVWQTTVTRRDGKVVAIVTQTQMVLDQFQRA
ncbi:PaaI family thioesterase [Paracoccus liaowanqingii]|nr:PaaI family thioesterase [Paracoccus liaowanqingii]